MKAVYFRSPSAFRAWLLENHEIATELLVGFHKRATGKPTMTWPESVDEALCVGWIDGVRRSVDEGRYTIRFTPRKRASNWSAVNVGRVAVLEKEGRMLPAGRAAFEARTKERTYAYEQRNAAAFPPEQQKAFEKNQKAWAWFQAQAPWYRKTATHWVVSAKKEETRERRFLQLVRDSAAGRPIGPLTRPGGAKKG